MNTGLRLLRYTRPYALVLGAAMAGAVLASIALVGLVSLSQPFFNEVLGLEPGGGASVVPVPGKIDALQLVRRWVDFDRLGGWFGTTAGPVIELTLLLVGLALVRSLFSYLSAYGIRRTGLQVVRDLRSDLYGTIQGQSLRFFAGYQPGELISRVTGDVARIERSVSGDLNDFLRVGFIALTQAVWVFYIYPGLAFVSLVLLPLIVIPIYQFGRRLRKASRVSQERMADVMSLLHESITGLRIVRAFGAERFELRRFRDGLGRMLRIDTRAARVNALTSPAMELVGAAAGGALVLYAGLQAQGGRLNPGEFMSYLAAMSWLYASLKRITKVNNQFQQALAAGKRVFQLIDAPVEVRDRSSVRPLAPFRRGIVFREVSFRYLDQPVLHGIDLELPAGSVIALAGRSGAGKTTVVNLLLRFYDPTSGVIEIDGVDIRDVTLRSLRDQIGLVTQEVNLFTDTVRSNIAYGVPDAAFDRIEAAARAAYAHEFIEALPDGYDTRIGRGGHGLSMGQLQRLSIARAIWKDPPILVLDEATSALDPESERLLDSALANLIRGRTVLVIAHRPRTIQRVDRIFVLADGRVVEQGDHDTLLRDGQHYRRVYDLEIGDPAVARTTDTR